MGRRWGALVLNYTKRVLVVEACLGKSDFEFPSRMSSCKQHIMYMMLPLCVMYHSWGELLEELVCFCGSLPAVNRSRISLLLFKCIWFAHLPFLCVYSQRCWLSKSVGSEKAGSVTAAGSDLSGMSFLEHMWEMQSKPSVACKLGMKLLLWVPSNPRYSVIPLGAKFIFVQPLSIIHSLWAVLLKDIIL